MEAADTDHHSDSHDRPNGRKKRPIILQQDAAESSNSPPLVPPYWSHRRYESYCSVGNAKPPPIILEDHTEGPFYDNNPAWAKGVSIDDYVLVAGSIPSAGNFVVWTCRIDTLNVGIPLVPSCSRLAVSQCHELDRAYIISGWIHNNSKEVKAYEFIICGIYDAYDRALDILNLMTYERNS